MATLNPETPKVVLQDSLVAFNPKNITSVDTFSIKTIVRDPFLGTLLVKHKANSSMKQPAITNVIWKPIVYHGMISNQNSKTRVFIVSIDNKQHLIKLGQAIDEVKLIKGTASNVLMSYKGIKKTFKKT